MLTLFLMLHVSVKDTCSSACCSCREYYRDMKDKPTKTEEELIDLKRNSLDSCGNPYSNYVQGFNGYDYSDCVYRRALYWDHYNELVTSSSHDDTTLYLCRRYGSCTSTWDYILYILLGLVIIGAIAFCVWYFVLNKNKINQTNP